MSVRHLLQVGTQVAAEKKEDLSRPQRLPRATSKPADVKQGQQGVQQRPLRPHSAVTVHRSLSLLMALGFFFNWRLYFLTSAGRENVASDL